MNFSEGSHYKLQKDYYECINLECTYVEGNIVWLLQRPSMSFVGEIAGYKLDKKTNKLYVFNKKCQSWDTVENTLSEYDAEDIIWSKRIGTGYNCIVTGGNGKNPITCK